MLLTINTAARSLGVRRTVLLAAIDAGDIPAEMDRRGVLKIRLEDAVTFAEQQETAIPRGPKALSRTHSLGE